MLTLKSDTGQALATGFTAVGGLTDIAWEIRFQASKLKNAGGGTYLFVVTNGTLYKTSAFFYADGTLRAIQVTFRDAGGQRFSEFALENALMADSDWLVLRGYYLSSDAGKFRGMLYDDEDNLIAAADEQQAEDTLVTTGYNILALARNGVNVAVDGLAIWDEIPTKNPNDEPTDIPSLISYHPFVGNGNNQVAGGAAFTAGGSSPGDYEYTSGGEWDEWGGGGPVEYEQAVAGSITPSGTLNRFVTTAYAGSITPSGSLVKTVEKLLTGEITPAGALSTQLIEQPEVFEVDVAGEITPSGSISITIGKDSELVGAITPAGALITQPMKRVGGVITPSGTLNRGVQKLLEGILTPSGFLSAGLIGPVGTDYTLNVAGSITPTGLLRNHTQKLLAGSISPAGALTTDTFPTPEYTDPGNSYSSAIRRRRR